MPRNASGTYSLPAGNPVVTLTTIASSWANTTLDDLKTEVTDSLSRSGKGGMLAPLALLDGAVGAPSLTFANELSTGLYRAAAGQLAAAVGGAQRLLLSATTPAAKFMSQLTAADSGDDFLLDTSLSRTSGSLLRVTNANGARFRVNYAGILVLGGSGTIQTTDTTNLGLVLQGNKAAADTGSDVVMTGSVARTAGNLLDVQNSGVSKVLVDYAGQIALLGTTVLYAAATNASLSLKGNRSAADAGADVVLTGQATRTAGNLLDVQNNAVSKLQVRSDGALNLLSAGTVFTDASNAGLLFQSNKSAADTGTDIILNSGLTRTAGRLLEVKNNGTAALYVSATTTEAIAINTWHRQRVSADVSTTSSTLQNVTGLSFAVSANADYEALLVVKGTRAAAGTNLLFAFSGPAAPTALLYAVDSFVAGVGTPESTGTYGTSLELLSGAGLTAHVFVVRLILRNGATAGTVQMQFKSSDNATSVTISQGSTLDWRRTDTLE